MKHKLLCFIMSLANWLWWYDVINVHTYVKIVEIMPIDVINIYKRWH